MKKLLLISLLLSGAQATFAMQEQEQEMPHVESHAEVTPEVAGVIYAIKEKMAVLPSELRMKILETYLADNSIAYETRLHVALEFCHGYENKLENLMRHVLPAPLTTNVIKFAAEHGYYDLNEQLVRMILLDRRKALLSNLMEKRYVNAGDREDITRRIDHILDTIGRQLIKPSKWISLMMEASYDPARRTSLLHERDEDIIDFLETVDYGYSSVYQAYKGMRAIRVCEQITLNIPSVIRAGKFLSVLVLLEVAGQTLYYYMKK